MKRFFIILVLLFTLPVGLIGGFVYLFDLNDHSQWITEQIEKSTGYQVRFELIENRGWPGSSFSVAGLSVALNKKELLYIDKMNIVIRDLDLWHRQLEVELVELAGVDLSVEVDALKKVVSDSKNVIGSDNNKQQLPWSKLQLNKLRITDLNADISNEQQEIRLQKASLSSDNLTIIEHNKLAGALLKGDLQFDFKTLNLQLDASQAIEVNDLSLRTHFNLAGLQATLTAAVKQLVFRLPDQTEVLVDNSLLEMQLDKNKLSLTRLSAKTFSGELQLQAEALFSLVFSPAFAFSVEKLTVLSLLAKDMRLKIPAFLQMQTDKPFSHTTQKQKLAVNTLFIKQIDLQNITISSEEKQLPLTVKGLNGHLQDFYLLQNNQLVSLSEGNKQTGLFALQFDYLQWADTVTEQFQVTGSFSEDAQQLLILKELLRLDGK